jgi:hypothetical protein
VSQDNSVVLCGPIEHDGVSFTANLMDILNADDVEAWRSPQESPDDGVWKILISKPLH